MLLLLLFEWNEIGSEIFSQRKRNGDSSVGLMRFEDTADGAGGGTEGGV